MGNFEKLSVVVIVVIIVMILVVALRTWTDRPELQEESGLTSGRLESPDAPEPTPDPSPFDLPPVPIPGPAPPSPDPVPEPTPAPVQHTEFTMYTIQPGDTLGGISYAVYGSTRYVSAIRDANPGLGEFLRAGSELRLPSKESVISVNPDVRPDEPPGVSPSGARPGGTYTTRRGDTWEKISRLVYKTKDRWPTIFARNSHLHDSAFSELPAGIEISLPE